MLTALPLNAQRYIAATTHYYTASCESLWRSAPTPDTMGVCYRHDRHDRHYRACYMHTMLIQDTRPERIRVADVKGCAIVDAPDVANHAQPIMASQSSSGQAVSSQEEAPVSSEAHP